jgi:betaine-aldehyde dehydrogenase
VGKQEGLRLACGGAPAASAQSGGYFIEPTIFVDVPTSSRLWVEEIFGPVLCVRTFETEEEAVQVANDTEYGLAAAVMSTNTNTLQRIAQRLRTGVVWTNCSQPAFVRAPWGGVRRSGLGRELGKWGMEEFLSVKQVTGCSATHSFGAFRH